MTISEGDLLASLGRLENLLHGDNVEKSQILTGGGSSQGKLKDMHPETYGDSWDDGIASDGTDYNGRGKQAKKALRSGGPEKTSKEVETEEARRLQEAEEGYEGDEEEDEEKALPQDEGDQKNLKKMMTRPRPSVGPGIRRSIEIEDDGEVHKGVEVSEFIFYLRKSIADAFEDMAYRVHDRINAHHAARGEFAKATAYAVADISRSLMSSEDYVEAEEAEPAHAAKSITREQDVEQTADLQKSLAKAQEIRASVLGEMQELLEKGSSVITPLDIIKYEGGGDPRPEIRALLKSLN